MNLRLSRWVFGLAAGALLLGSAAPAQAGIIPWLYDAVFGPVGSMGYGQSAAYGPSYGYASYGGGYGGATYAPASPCGPGGCGVQAYYGPGYYTPGCNNCGGCSDCAGGACAAAPATGGALRPEPDRGFTPNTNTTPNNSNTPRTYEERPMPDDAGFGPAAPAPAGAAAEPMPETFEPPMPVPARRPAIAPAGGLDLGEDEEGATIAPLQLDGKVTFKSSTERSRLTLRPRYTSAKITRRPSHARTEWTTAEPEIAKK